MEKVAGIPLSILFSIIGAFGVYIFYDFRRQIQDRLTRMDKRIEKVELAAKELSRQEFDQVKTYVRESINMVINSKEFRDDLKSSIKEVILHVDRNRSQSEAAIFTHFEDMLKEINTKLTTK